MHARPEVVYARSHSAGNLVLKRGHDPRAVSQPAVAGSVSREERLGGAVDGGLVVTEHAEQPAFPVPVRMTLHGDVGAIEQGVDLARDRIEVGGVLILNLHQELDVGVVQEPRHIPPHRHLRVVGRHLRHGSDDVQDIGTMHHGLRGVGKCRRRGPLKIGLRVVD